MIHYNFLIIFFFYILFSSNNGQSTTSITLNSYPLILLSYSFPKSDTIRFTLESDTKGYAAIGFGSRMSGTNILIGYKSNGVLVIKDTICYEHSAPVDHSTQNVALINASRDTSNTIFVFERLLNTGDSSDFTIVPFNNVPIIWAYGSSDALNGHTNFGSTTVVFTQCDITFLTCSGPSSSNCLTCTSDKTLNNGKCAVVCDPTCLTCSGGSCTSCDSNHILSNGVCVTLTCDNSVSALNCTSCSSGKYLSNWQCLSCDSSCLTCSAGGLFDCNSCSSGKYLSSKGQCSPCQNSCLTCTNGSYFDCLTCPLNHILNNDGAYISNYTQCPIDNGSSCFSIQLYSNPTINLNYSILSNDTIKITMEYYSQGFIAIGFGMNMSEANIILANFTNGSIMISERNSTGHFEPIIDNIQSIILFMGARTPEKLLFHFKEKWIQELLLNPLSISCKQSH